MRIREVSTVGLKGATPEGGWSEELKPDDVVHTLVTVHTDEGPVGYGSVFTSEALVRAALEMLEPLYTGENRLDRKRLPEHCYPLGIRLRLLVANRAGAMHYSPNLVEGEFSEGVLPLYGVLRSSVCPISPLLRGILCIPIYEPSTLYIRQSAV